MGFWSWLSGSPAPPAAKSPSTVQEQFEENDQDLDLPTIGEDYDDDIAMDVDYADDVDGAAFQRQLDERLYSDPAPAGPPSTVDAGKDYDNFLNDDLGDEDVGQSPRVPSEHSEDNYVASRSVFHNDSNVSGDRGDGGRPRRSNVFDRDEEFGPRINIVPNDEYDEIDPADFLQSSDSETGSRGNVSRPLRRSSISDIEEDSRLRAEESELAAFQDSRDRETGTRGNKSHPPRRSSTFPEEEEFGARDYFAGPYDEFDDFETYMGRGDLDDDFIDEPPSRPPPVVFPPDPSNILQTPRRPKKTKKSGISRDTPPTPLAGYAATSPRPLIADGPDDFDSPAFLDPARIIDFRPRRSASFDATAMPYEAPPPRTPAPKGDGLRHRGRDITPDPRIRTPVSPTSGRRIPYNFRQSTRPSRMPSTPPRTSTRAPSTASPTTRRGPGRPPGRPAGVGKPKKKGGKKHKKQFRCPNCRVEITLTPMGHPSAKFKTPDGTVGRKVTPVVPRTQISPLGYKTFKGKDGRLYLRKKNHY